MRVAVCALACLVPSLAAAQGWPERKCALYTVAATRAFASAGLDGIGAAFATGHADFLASGCTLRGRICPQTPQEIALADRLTVLAMNEGMASTFLPFSCRDPDAPARNRWP
jgi:hypothetical protein